MRRLLAAAMSLLALLPASGHAAEAVLLHAAGSLRDPLTEVARAFEAAEGAAVTTTFGPSGLLRDAIAGGTKAEVFASANMEHPRALAQAKRSGPVVLFARNQLCALVRPGLAVTTATLLDRMLDPQIKLGTATPKADPSGDYAWEAFGKAEAVRAGSFAALAGKALPLTGGAASPKPPTGRSVYGSLVERGEADLFLTYCTNARAAAREVEGAGVVDLPEALAVGADYGLTVMNGSSEAAYRLALFILSPEGRAILSRHGFRTSGAP
ncbi:molybdate ABC transporter substrate-binding protein [Methylobacterium sp. Leaf118]|uniref:molybdate ABC transporter substrate-binding protein n=1 Tax=Methylobacterium sp. Leaf118 TaxID=2876562 RepID=UPI001E2F32EB|nr:molybdate ABC transporter substrate-binding protein [Methylobacterium sp. Leaf118]